MLLFKNNRADIAKRGLEPDPVIKALHKFKDRLPGLCTRLEANEVNAFTLERSEERLGDGVIPAISFAAGTAIGDGG